MTDRPTSDAEIRQACPGISTWLYQDLARLGQRGAFPRLPIAVLYETSPGFGHWVGLLETPEGVEHFDSYGIRPDGELKWVPKEYKAAFLADSPHMVRLLYRAALGGAQINYNEHRLQSKSPAVATCGRWVALRARNNHLTATEFAKAVRKKARDMGITPDELTVRLVPL